MNDLVPAFIAALTNKPPLPPAERIQSMTADEVEFVRDVESQLRLMPQPKIPTRHVLHGGMYARTICLPAGVVVTGALIKRATLLIYSGNAVAYVGGESVALKGYGVLPASAGRKQIVFAYEDTELTAIFPTNAKTIADAENELTDEAALTVSHGGNGEGDIVIITGE
jgi:hypothetical protein